MINLIFGLFFSALIGSIVIHGFVYYRASTETDWKKRLWATSRDSAVWFWGKCLLVSGFSLEAIQQFAAQFAGAQDFNDFIKEHVTADRVAVVLMVFGIITFIARARTMTRDIFGNLQSDK